MMVPIKNNEPISYEVNEVNKVNRRTDLVLGSGIVYPPRWKTAALSDLKGLEILKA
jgi:hypothetical protein